MTIFRATFIWTAGRLCLSFPVDGWSRIIARQAIFKIIARQAISFILSIANIQICMPWTQWARSCYFYPRPLLIRGQDVYDVLSANFLDKKYACANFFASCMSVSITTIITTDLLTLWSGEYTFSNRQIEALWVFANCWWIYEVNFFFPLSTFVSKLFPMILLL